MDQTFVEKSTKNISFSHLACSDAWNPRICFIFSKLWRTSWGKCWIFGILWTKLGGNFLLLRKLEAIHQYCQYVSIYQFQSGWRNFNCNWYSPFNVSWLHRWATQSVSLRLAVLLSVIIGVNKGSCIFWLVETCSETQIALRKCHVKTKVYKGDV